MLRCSDGKARTWMMAIATNSVELIEKVKHIIVAFNIERSYQSQYNKILSYDGVTSNI